MPKRNRKSRNYLSLMLGLFGLISMMVFGYVAVENSHRQKVIAEVSANREDIKSLLRTLSIQMDQLYAENGRVEMINNELGGAEKIAEDHDLHPTILGLYLRSAAIHQHTENIVEKMRDMRGEAINHQTAIMELAEEPAILINLTTVANAAQSDASDFISTATLERLALEGKRVIDRLRNLTETAHISAARTSRSMWLIERNVIELKRDMKSRIGLVRRGFEDANLPITGLIKKTSNTIPVPYALIDNKKTPLLSTKTTNLMLAEAFALRKELTRLHQALPLSKPVKNLEVSSGFGYRIDPFTKKRAFHEGLDFKGPRGTNILASGHGIVTEATNKNGYGKMVAIAHEHGMKSLYAHLDKILVKKGQKVRLGDPIGTLGNTGRSTGPHLHYEIQQHGKPFDPKSFIEAGQNLEQIFAETGMTNDQLAAN